MKKKRRNPRPERSAFESARAALERAGEEYPPVTEEDAPETPETSESANVPEEPETPASVVADDTRQPDAVEYADDAEAQAVEAMDGAEAQTVEAMDNAEAQAVQTIDDAEAQAVEAMDGAETQVVEPMDGAETQVVEPMDGAEAQVVEPMDGAEAQAVQTIDDAEAQAVQTTDGAEAQTVRTIDNVEAQAVEAMDGAETETPQSADNIETQVPESTEQAAAFVQPDTSAGEVPDAVPAFAEESVDASADEPEAVEDADAESGWDADYEPFPDAGEVTDTERHTMETKEITLGYKGPDADEPEADEEESGKKSEKRGKKPRFSFKTFHPLNRLKDAVGEYVSREKADKEPDDVPPSAASRDVAIRKRVMQMEDEETRNYLLDRVLPQMTWYGRKSAQYKTAYYRLMLATIVLGALIPISSLLAHPVVPAILGVSVTAINAYIALHNYRDFWMTYQTARETLIHTLYCYFNQAGVFAHGNLSPEDLNVLLVNVCEDTLSKELGGWTTILQKT